MNNPITPVSLETISRQITTGFANVEARLTHLEAVATDHYSYVLAMDLKVDATAAAAAEAMEVLQRADAAFTAQQLAVANLTHQVRMILTELSSKLTSAE